MAKRSKARACGRPLAGIGGSNPTGVIGACLVCVLSDGGLCDGPITRPEESYWLRCVIQKPKEWGGPGPRWAVAPEEQNI
jgi:hypothetical protein